MLFGFSLFFLNGVNMHSNYFAVIENGLYNQLCIKMFPEISYVVHSIVVDIMIESVSNMFDSYTNWECLKRNHKFCVVLAF